MRGFLAAILAVIFSGTAAARPNPAIYFTTGGFRDPEGGGIFEEVGLYFDYEQGYDTPIRPLDISSFRLGVTLNDADVGVTFTPWRRCSCLAGGGQTVCFSPKEPGTSRSTA